MSDPARTPAAEASAPLVLPMGLLALTAFLSSAGNRVIDPLLHVIATDFGTDVPAVSVVVAAYTLPYGACQLLLGPLGDRFGKMRVIHWAMIANTLACVLCGVAASLHALTLGRVAAGAASAAIIPVAMAYIGDAVAYSERQVTLSRFLNGLVLAQMLAGPVGGVFGEYIGWRGVFLLLAAGSAAATVVLGLRLRGLPDRRGGAGSFRVINYVLLLRSAESRLVLLATIIDGMVLMGAFPFMAPYMHEEIGLSYAEVGLILACFGAGAYIYTRLARVLVARLGEPGLVAAGGLVSAVGVIIAVATDAWAAFIVVETLLGLGYFLLHSVLQARATELLPHARATAVAAFAFVLFFGQSIGALAMGVLIARFGYRGAFAVDAVALLGLGAWLSWRLRGYAAERSA
jgi:YNFM family putative membrane transporter